MNALCNCSHEVTVLLVGNDDFCAFIELQMPIKGLLVQHYLNQSAEPVHRHSLQLKRMSGSLLPTGYEEEDESLLAMSQRHKLSSEGVVEEFLK